MYIHSISFSTFSYEKEILSHCRPFFVLSLLITNSYWEVQLNQYLVNKNINMNGASLTTTMTTRERELEQAKRVTIKCEVRSTPLDRIKCWLLNKFFYTRTKCVYLHERRECRRQLSKHRIIKYKTLVLTHKSALFCN